LYFGASNYLTEVYVNGKLVGKNEGGFHPFNFLVNKYLVNGENHVVVAVNNERNENYVPPLVTDWWNYGGITRSVKLLELDKGYIKDYKFLFTDVKPNNRNSRANLSFSYESDDMDQTTELLIPELNIKEKIKHGNIDIQLSNLTLWSPENPKLYSVMIVKGNDTIKDDIGIRSILVKGTSIFINNKKTFFKGVSIHEESPNKMGRVSSESEAKILLNWAKDLNCNYIRLAHYPHNEDMVKMAEKMGLMVWSEIPVYWDINWDNEHTYEVAENMLKTIIKRDKNRANVIIWSVANETPRKNSRTKFLYKLISKVRELDSQRLVSAALHEVDFDKNTNTKIINDDLANLVDILAINNYCGWYGGSDCQNLNWKSSYNKPMFMSEFGGGSLFGLHGSSDERWTEEFQDNIYREHFKMFEKIDFLSGVSPWILKDFKTPIRMLPGIQDQWNRKGLVSDRGQFKKAFFSLKNFYEKL